jgi:very-short-patch-repair endonuclease
MLDWAEWKVENKEKIAHIVGFEEKFVDTVLAKIPLISPSDVIPQFHFVDTKGINRYIDFMIISKTKGYCIPIELDGLTKIFQDGREYHKFNDFLERQNALVSKFGMVLRYSNKKMLHESSSIVREITDTLNRQSQHKNTEEVQAQQVKSQIIDYENQIKLLQANPVVDGSGNLKKLIERMQSQILILNNKISSEKESKNSLSDFYKKSGWILGIAGFLISLVVVYYFAHKKTDLTYEPKISAPIDIEKIDLIRSAPMTEPERAQTIEPERVETIEPEPATTIAPVYVVGEYVKVCGRVAQVKEFSKGVYLSIGQPYPNQDITILAWREIESTAAQFLNKKICTSGTVTDYKGKPQLEINSLDALSFN